MVYSQAKLKLQRVARSTLLSTDLEAAAAGKYTDGQAVTAELTDISLLYECKD